MGSSSNESRLRAKAIVEEVRAKLHQTDPKHEYWSLSALERTELRTWMIERYSEAIAADEAITVFCWELSTSA